MLNKCGLVAVALSGLFIASSLALNPWVSFTVTLVDYNSEAFDKLK